MKPTNIILEGITGSKAYGLDHEDSDSPIREADNGSKTKLIERLQ